MPKGLVSQCPTTGVLRETPLLPDPHREQQPVPLLRDGAQILGMLHIVYSDPHSGEQHMVLNSHNVVMLNGDVDPIECFWTEHVYSYHPLGCPAALMVR